MQVALRVGTAEDRRGDQTGVYNHENIGTQFTCEELGGLMEEGNTRE